MHVSQTDIAYDPQDVGRAIRARRKKLGYTQAEVARFNQCSIRFLSELERGKEGAGIGQVIRIMNSLGLDLATLERE
ncbi:helix-turn-helix domain-containing protein [Gordonibacter massiliensis (ex Traore et al. 2017)]|uniref:Helix-turn-helix transcriptional regulator n=1 Tax=Gordonibacter massiliensis (ex Traore et al. 2017) TaxID=1841863 RepID=A0A842JG57_9ACTN|nr:helix-turn-helix domain-containing protein [Gordonibacter massiliensis (ex Traore et al. 2017)]MBC2889461.1 helix-turn-helix transcriptional regulator [Gordonibacter massiliensis (ex Traore et al. 2017)]